MGTARDIALIFLSLEALVIALVPLALIGGLAYGLFYLTKLAREYLHKAQGYVQQGYDVVERTSRQVAAPFIKAHAAWSAASALARGVYRRISGNESEV